MPSKAHAADRRHLRDDLLAALACVANVPVPDWPALVRDLERALAHLRAALARLEGGETAGEHRAYLADLEYGLERRSAAPRGQEHDRACLRCRLAGPQGCASRTCWRDHQPELPISLSGPEARRLPDWTVLLEREPPAD